MTTTETAEARARIEAALADADRCESFGVMVKSADLRLLLSAIPDASPGRDIDRRRVANVCPNCEGDQGEWLYDHCPTCDPASLIASAPTAERLRRAAVAVCENAAASYRSRGQDRYIEDDSGERMMLVPHEDWHNLATACGYLGAALSDAGEERT